ncbi:alternative oxidase [Clavulina sp. PMI_390]|nr:alternative oxidase [Clavulina sp. PMI_390]
MLHPVYTEAENHSVQVFHREPQNLSDKTAIFLSSIARWGFDFVSGYKHKEIPAGSTMSVKELREQGYIMNEKQWLARIIFLETIAGVPGMVAAALRHLRSLRLMQRDNAWINTLLQEAENERMHLMSFMTLTKPSIFFRAMILGAQGVFWNVMFFGYLLSPKTCHRFVGTIEEEAVLTYSRLIKDLEAGLVPEWENEPAPQIAIEYWRLPQDAKLIDMIYAVRSDESTHRFVNHSLANLKAQDVNPFAMGEPSMITKGTRPGFERDEAMNFILKNQEAFAEAREKAAIEAVCLAPETEPKTPKPWCAA